MNPLTIALTLCLLQPDPAPRDGIEPRQCFELATYDSRTECDIVARSLRVKATGARIRCRPRELSPDERRAIALTQGRGL